MKKILLGNEAIVQAALESGVDFVSGYPGCPSAEIGDIFAKIAEKNGVYTEWSTNEKVALEAAIGASFSGLKSLVNMKSFGINVCSDSLFPLAYTGTKAPMVIVVADDPSCWSSAQTEQDSRGYAYISRIPFLEPADPKECYEFTKLAFEMSEKFNLPIILRTTTRVAHQRSIVEIGEIKKKQLKKGEFVKNPERFSTMPPRVMKMKADLLGKLEKIEEFNEKIDINFVNKGKSKELGIITSGVSYLHVLEAQKEMGTDFPVLKIGTFYPLPNKKIRSFIKEVDKVLVVEELEGYLDKEVQVLAKYAKPSLMVHGKNVVTVTFENNTEKVISAINKVLGKEYKRFQIKQDPPRRWPRPCLGCPHLMTFSILKKMKDIVFGGDIGCYMLAGTPDFNLQDYLFSMGASVGIGHGISKSTNQKVVVLMGDGTFFHAGIPALINTVYNKSNPLIIVLDNRTTAMTGHQTNPGVGKNSMGQETTEIRVEDIAKACGIKNIKVIDPINTKEYEDTIKEFLDKKEPSLIVAKRICALLARRNNEKRI